MQRSRASVVVVIDGSNVARCASWREHSRASSDHDLRRTLVDAVASWIATAPNADEVQLVFDGAGPWAPGETRITPVVTVIGSGKRSGDDVVVVQARAHARGRTQFWIVSSDREVRAVAGASALRTLGADSFVQLLAAPATPTSERGTTEPSLRRGISELVDDDVRAKLERLRRGE